MRFVPTAADSAADNLRKIGNIVMLLMENRSFDHMLGYLKLEENRCDVDGLTPGMTNSDGQKDYPIHHLDHTALKSNQDPCHSGRCVADQLANNNGGFVKNYVTTYPGDSERDLVMGYYNKNELLTYDYLAAEFTICDHWFSSVSGATWPNRLYVDHQNYFAPLLQQGRRKHPGSGQESDVSQSLGACVDRADAAALASKGEL